MSKTVSIISKNFGTVNPESIEEYIAAGGFEGFKKAISMTPEEIIEVINSTDLQGRGGAAFPVAKKWAGGLRVKAPVKGVICNADEGEPGTFKDRAILEFNPFSVIEGMLISAFTAGGREENHGRIYIREEYTYLHERVRKAIDQAKEKGFLGNNILGTGLNMDMKVVSGAGAYVCGESSALLESMEGKAGRPRIKPPRLNNVGLYNLPTLLNNVETFSIVSIILRDKSEYVSVGTPKSMGCKLISVSGNVKNPGVYEIPFGTTVKDVIYDIAGGLKSDRPLKFVQIGGASGGVMPASLIDTPISYEGLCGIDMSVGSGAVVVADDSNSVVDYMESISHFFAEESCGKCTPCREGNRQIVDIVGLLEKGDATMDDFDRLVEILEFMKYASFCGLGKTEPAPFLDFIKHFKDEILQSVK
ncbi:NADH-quinone oxidoreductase subunit F [Peptoclostridium litorale DSM 5388]|uniref:NADP-reducing hydrogenase subunit HndC n=1 Tax=Peptoclostridium litorale DSM 5388 TaxID=1121324 RepID=A0A069RFH7_PEPLI|nr:NADH-ubiquinone oxidoreductase-F iron-sulfur binding region domain-containing protein [Peptoclostridium litorale]KDR94950.1 NADP-reducing hydrogenase subunit HndC [Peptoclostridium litorale DSM 5388]SIO33905.1 NADH-quinone oxidoreductase subunit F [Peptoclostridium litorale DSM 5388]